MIATGEFQSVHQEDIAFLALKFRANGTKCEIREDPGDPKPVLTLTVYGITWEEAQGIARSSGFYSRRLNAAN